MMPESIDKPRDRVKIAFNAGEGVKQIPRKLRMAGIKESARKEGVDVAAESGEESFGDQDSAEVEAEEMKE